MFEYYLVKIWTTYVNLSKKWIIDMQKNVSLKKNIKHVA